MAKGGLSPSVGLFIFDNLKSKFHKVYDQFYENLNCDPINRHVESNLQIFNLTKMHLSITLANEQRDAQFFDTFITVLYMYMFRAISCSSSGRQIVLTL
jgi:hypothetical protein